MILKEKFKAIKNERQIKVRLLRNEIKGLKRIIDLALIEITRDLDFKPNRFRQCPRCGNFFYQPTEKKSIYCSIRCGNAVRLQHFRKKKSIIMHEKSDESNLH